MIIRLKKHYKLVLGILTLLCLSLLLIDFSKPLKGKIDYMVINKKDRELLVFNKNNKLLKKYKVALGFRPTGKKEFEGDGKTPEGIYYINDKNPNSVAYKNLGISYPNSEDIENAKRHNRSTGGSIKIHGLMKKWVKFGRFHRFVDWTGGCIAVSNSEMEELYKNVPLGTKIIINP
jgi:murein L,D-transpeptidase YafK